MVRSYAFAVITTLSQGEPGDNVLATRGWAGSSGRRYNGQAGGADVWAG
jgi:hypothetical protein